MKEDLLARMKTMDRYGFRFKGIIQNENKDECNITVTSNDKNFLEYFKKIIDIEFKRYNQKLISEEIEEKGDYCDFECTHYYVDYETRYDDNGCPYDEDISRCRLGRSEFYDRKICKCYEERI